jgi:signal transduction histidine kinase
MTVECDPALPAVWADHDRLEQVFVNLLTNALRHNAPGTMVSVSVRERSSSGPAADLGSAGAQAAPAEVEITIADDGIGFPSDLAFAPFDTARRQQSPSSGSGLGLSITKGIVEAHGGRIALVPTSAGTTFQIRLLVEAAAASGVDGEGPQSSGDEERVASLAGTLPPAVAPEADG